MLYLREVNKFLALVCIIREENFSRQGVIDYNFLCFREAISQVFELRLKNQKMEAIDQDAEDGSSVILNDSVQDLESNQQLTSA